MFFLLKSYKKKLSDMYCFLSNSVEGKKQFRKTFTIKCILSLICPASAPLFMLAGNKIFLCILSVIVVILLIWILPDAICIRKCSEKRRLFALEMPDFLDRIAMLSEAGITLWKAVCKAASVQSEGALYNELQIFLQELSANPNHPENALSALADRCSCVAVSSFVSTVVQNSRKGSSEVASVFKMQADICRNERRNIARRLTDEASTLLLLPTAMIFGAILVLLAAPALMQLLW